jgi:LPXTG-site transpeptidase (sortase) family protein
MRIGKRTILFGMLVAAFIFSGFLVNATLYAPAEEIVPKSPVLQDNFARNIISPSLPTRLIIPSLEVDAKVQQVGITKKGNMATPNNFTDVGWYKYGAIPGNKGSAVIAGHVDNGIALPGVFKNLKNIKIGDEILVESETGTIKFLVTKLDIYDFDAKVDSIFNQKDDYLLRLITCTGTWVPQYKTHDKRLVVTATKAPGQ